MWAINLVLFEALILLDRTLDPMASNSRIQLFSTYLVGLLTWSPAQISAFQNCRYLSQWESALQKCQEENRSILSRAQKTAELESAENDAVSDQMSSKQPSLHQIDLIHGRNRTGLRPKNQLGKTIAWIYWVILKDLSTVPWEDEW